MSLLFVGGPQRSGTTTLVHYLNRHPEVLLYMERYKWVPPRYIRPELFAFERILDYRRSPHREEREETNTPREYQAKLLASKDPKRLKWIGDKNPAYVSNLDRLSENNPGPASSSSTVRSRRSPSPSRPAPRTQKTPGSSAASRSGATCGTPRRGSPATSSRAPRTSTS